MYPGEVEGAADGILLCLKRLGKTRWPAWERKLLQYAGLGGRTPLLALKYADEIIGKRWPELESILMSNWPMLREYMEWEGFSRGTGVLERIVLASRTHKLIDRAHAALQYAAAIGGNRWVQGEAVILKATTVSDAADGMAEVAEAYRRRFFPRQAWPALNDRIRTAQCSPCFMVQYLRHSKKSCSREVQEGLLSISPTAEGFTEAMATYAEEVLGGQLPDDLHGKMMLKSFEVPDDSHVKRYFEICR